MEQRTKVAHLLQRWGDGDPDALGALMPLVYAELRNLASRVMHSERSSHTLQPTALVHEAFLRLVHGNHAARDRVHFFALAATVMRHVLLDWAKARTRGKRGGKAMPVTLREEDFVSMNDPWCIIEIDRLLVKMETFDARKAKIVEMIFFSGMTYDEAAEANGVSTVTVHRELKMAKAWMLSEMNPPPPANLLP